MKKICNTCGTQYPEDFRDTLCPICAEPRQYIPTEGQSWTSETALQATHMTKVLMLNDRLNEFVIDPKFAIGQRALFVQSPQGNLLWDCIPLLDKKTIDLICRLGGLRAIAFSHPHYYSNMNDWAEAFSCPIYIHKKDAAYIYEAGDHVKLWEGDEINLWDDLKLVNIGGHFDGSSMLLIGALGKHGTILTGDTMYLSPNRQHYAFMYSYPNRIPLKRAEIIRIKTRLEGIEFDTAFGFYSYQNMIAGAKELALASLDRYLE